MAVNSANPIDDNPVPAMPGSAADSQAADLIRQKLDEIYGQEPAAAEEEAEAEASPRRSKHQQFIYELSNSGKDLATVQTEWHNYYQSLPASEKHQVWQEFYSSQSLLTGQAAAPDPQQVQAQNKQQVADSSRAKTRSASRAKKLRDVRSTDEVKQAIRDKVTAGGKLQAKHHLQSLLFGLGMGFLVLVIFLFGFFNEVFIAPFIQPSRVAASTPLIINSNSVAPTDKPEVIIPKINVEIPVDYNQTTTNENDIENALESGVVHYPTTKRPGETGNAAFFGHSSNNIFNKGKYKFAFVLLHTLVPGDTFYLTYGGKVYVYKVITKDIVDPGNVSVLNDVPGQTATATLITCDPPGTSLRRLIIVGQQISPDPTGNVAPAATTVSSATTSSLPGNGPTLLGRTLSTGAGKAVAVVGAAGIVIFVIRRFNRPSGGSII